MSGARRGQVWLEWGSKTKGDGVGEVREGAGVLPEAAKLSPLC